MEPRPITQLLRDDHKRILGLFRQLEAAGSRAPEMREPVLRELLMELEIHRRGDEEVLFSAIGPVEETIEELREIERMAAVVRRLSPQDSRFKEALNELIAAGEAHFESEDRGLLPEAEKRLGESSSGLGESYVNLREQVLQDPKNRHALPEVVQDSHGGEQMRRHETRPPSPRKQAG